MGKAEWRRRLSLELDGFNLDGNLGRGEGPGQLPIYELLPPALLRDSLWTP